MRRVLSYPISPEWVLHLAQKGLSVDYVLAIGKHIWPWDQYEMPANATYVADPSMSDYHCIIAPVGNIPHDGTDTNVFTRFLQLAVQSGISLHVVRWNGTDESCSHALDLIKQNGLSKTILEDVDQDFIAAHASPIIVGTRLKRRWENVNNPAWLRLCYLVVSILTEDNSKEIEGTVSELDCGDGAFVGFLRSRFSKLEVYGYCRNEQEKELARKVDARLSVSLFPDDLSRVGGDYMICIDASPEDLVFLRDNMEKSAKKFCLITLQKGTEDIQGPMEIIELFKGWRVAEILSHYIITKKIC